MNEEKFVLKISPEDYMAYYQGRAQDVVATSFNGKRIQFPAKTLRPFVSHKGISGIFVIKYDSNNKLIALEKIAELEN